VRYAVRALDEIPQVPDADVDWHPLQHFFGLTAFGANLFVARDAGDELIARHHESESGQEELYLVLRGRVHFVLDGEEHDVSALGVVAVPEPSVTREATAAEPGAMLLALGAPAADGFESTWRGEWFEDVPKLH
jgi:quercetin dioxygenase-like cupin family protein